jgi:spermidine synthase
MTAISIAIFLVSAAALALELVLVRIFSIGHWHHFSYLVISTALLGFGAGGTFAAVFSKTIVTHHKKWLWYLAIAFGAAVPIVFRISGRVPLDELQLIWDKRQVLYLFVYYLLFFIPFFCAGTFTAVVFTAYADRASRLYFYNMTGSGFGAAGIVALMYGISPEQLLLVISFAAFAAALVLAFIVARQWGIITAIAAILWLFAFSTWGPFRLQIKISENKSLVYYRALPESETLAVRYSPLGRLDCIQAPTIRQFPGLSLSYNGSLPQQVLIITDADSVSAVNKFNRLMDLECYDYVTSAIAYPLLEKPDVCIIGAGGGSDVGQALLLGSRHVTAVEMNLQIIELVRNILSDFASGIYDRNDVSVIIAEGRNFLQTTDAAFDIISMSMLDSFSASAAGVYALNESHLYTVEALDLAIRRLRACGLLSITRMLKYPPRDSLKMLATVAEVLRRRGVAEPAAHIIMIRSWATATIVVSPAPLSDSQIEAARKFAEERSFDLVHIPGIKPDEVNRYHVLEEPVYYQSAQRLLSADYKTFERDYAYNIAPATDDRPYFFDFFKWRSLPYMIGTLGRQWLPFSEWGYLVLVAAIVQAVAASAVFILLPLFIAKPLKEIKSGRFGVLCYFLLLGLAYMFLEMGFIQKMTLLIGHPVFGVAVTLTGFLVFSGLGSLASGCLSSRLKFSGLLIPAAVAAIIIIGLAAIIFLSVSFDWLVGFTRPIRIVLGIAITAPLAFFMGMPFPTGLKLVHSRAAALVPWAWGINGFASVTAAVLGTFLAISLGFTMLAGVALVCYAIAAVVSRQIA